MIGWSVGEEWVRFSASPLLEGKERVKKCQY